MYDHDTPMLFPIIRESIGQSYDAVVSQFTCPIDGVYFFSATIAVPTSYEKSSRAKIKKNMRNISTATADFSNAEYVESGSTSAMVVCDAGDRVWIQTGNVGNETQTVDADDGRTSFSGALLLPLL